MNKHYFPIALSAAEDPSAVLPPSGGGAAPEPSSRESRAKRCECEFCGCTLTTAGEVLSFSDRARKMRNHGETIERLEREKAALDTEIRELKARLTPTSEPTRRRANVAVVGSGD